MSRLIDADALIDKHGDWYTEEGTEEGYIGTIKDIVESMPTIEPEQRWIPCSETEDLPKHEVLCCDKYGEELIGWLSNTDGDWMCESDGELMADPIAWREKPEPWRGE